METGKLYMQYKGNGQPEVVFEPENGNIWLTSNQIAQLLGCFAAKVTSNIKVIFKSEILRKQDVCCHYRYTVPNTEYPERQGVLYNLEMIIALAYRIKSYNSEVFRNWLIKRACFKQLSVMKQLTGERKISLN
jgi:hypothetical protein